MLWIVVTSCGRIEIRRTTKRIHINNNKKQIIAVKQNSNKRKKTYQQNSNSKFHSNKKPFSMQIIFVFPIPKLSKAINRCFTCNWEHVFGVLRSTINLYLIYQIWCWSWKKKNLHVAPAIVCSGHKFRFFHHPYYLMCPLEGEFIAFSGSHSFNTFIYSNAYFIKHNYVLIKWFTHSQWNVVQMIKMCCVDGDNWRGVFRKNCMTFRPKKKWLELKQRGNCSFIIYFLAVCSSANRFWWEL